MNIAEVIAWKFNHQPGMRCAEIDGVLQIVDFPGGVPTQEEQSAWVTEYMAVQAPKITEAALESAVDVYIDTVASVRRYGTASMSPTAACLSYKGSINPLFAADAAAFEAWRTNVWLYLIQQADLVYHGLRSIPTEAELIAEIDAVVPMVWPT